MTWCLLASTFMCALPALAQDLRGVAVARGTGEPIAGALVELLGDADEDVRAASVTNDSGGFRVVAPGGGRYRLRLRRIGFDTWVSAPVDASDSPVRLEVPVVPIPLPDLTASASRTCDGSPDELLAAYELYDDAVRALEPVIWTETAGLHVFRVELATRGPESFPAGTRVRPEHYEALDRYRETGDPITAPAGDREAYIRFLEMTYPAPPETVTVRRPIATLGSETLVSDGYARADDESEIAYFSPTASSLASDAFRENHCFRVGEEGDGRIALRFEPLPGQTIPDIRGTVWLSADRRHVSVVDFEYTELRPFLREHQVPQLRAAARRDPDRLWDGAYRFSFGSIRMRGEFGGRLEFERLPDGTAVTRRWELRIPLMWYFSSFSRNPPEVNGFPVALELTRSAEVTDVLTLGDVADTVSGGR